VIYIDTEGGARDIATLTKEDPYSKYVLYKRLTTNDQLIRFLQRLKEELGKYASKREKVLLIIDSISAPALAQWARSKRYDERGIVSLEKIDAVTRVLELVDYYEKKEEKKIKLVPVLVLHPLSEMSVQRQLQQVARKLAELQGLDTRRQKISVDDLPEEIRLMYQRPTGGKALHYIKEIWLSRLEASGTIEQLEAQRLLGDDEVNLLLQKITGFVKSLSLDDETKARLLNEARKVHVTKFRIYAWGSRAYPPAEPLIDLYLLDMLDQHLTTYRILVTPRTSSKMRLRVL